MEEWGSGAVGAMVTAYGGVTGHCGGSLVQRTFWHGTPVSSSGVDGVFWVKNQRGRKHETDGADERRFSRERANTNTNGNGAGGRKMTEAEAFELFESTFVTTITL